MQTGRTLGGIFLLALSLMACADKGDYATPAQNLYAAASDLSVAEPQLLNALNEEMRQLHLTELAFHYLQGDRLNFPQKRQTLISDRQIALRVDGVRAIQLYAQRLMTLTSEQPNKDLDAYSAALGKDLQATDVPHAYPGLPPEQAKGFAAAISLLAGIVIDKMAVDTIVDSANQAQPLLAKIVEIVKSEDAILKNQLLTQLDTAKTFQQAILEDLRDDKLRKSWSDYQTATHAGTPRIYPTPPYYSASTTAGLYDAFAKVMDSDKAAATLDEIDRVSKLADTILQANAALGRRQPANFGVFSREAYRRGTEALDVAAAAKP